MCNNDRRYEEHSYEHTKGKSTQNRPPGAKEWIGMNREPASIPIWRNLAGAAIRMNKLFSMKTKMKPGFSAFSVRRSEPRQLPQLDSHLCARDVHQSTVERGC